MSLTLAINEETYQDTINIQTGLLSPLQGFLTELEYRSVVEKCSLPNQTPWTIPVTLDLREADFDRCHPDEEVTLSFNGKPVAKMKIESRFEIDSARDLIAIFGTDQLKHPGVEKELKRSPFRVGGPIRVFPSPELDRALNPAQTQNIFKKHGWSTVAGFQTRNPVHRAHEYLQRIAMEVCDGIFINPLTGWKKVGDFSPEAILKSYQVMINDFYPKTKVYFDVLKTQMRYAGPREAVFHALIRKNLGCTHFIIGRDHAGVGGFYGKYEAQDFALNLDRKLSLGIQILPLKGPYYCDTCATVVTESTCAHADDSSEISGTLIRKMLQDKQVPPEKLMRKEVAQEILKLGDGIFIH